MAEISQGDRQQMYARDVHRCIRCGAEQLLTCQHRAAVGMGGSKVQPRVLECVTACLECNMRFESDLQGEALRFGWKVRRWANAAAVPVFYPLEGIWCVLINDTRRPVAEAEAVAMMHAVYGQEQYEKWGLAA